MHSCGLPPSITSPASAHRTRRPLRAAHYTSSLSPMLSSDGYAPAPLGYLTYKQFCKNKASAYSRNTALVFNNRSPGQIVECSNSPSSGGDKKKVPFGYTRKDVILIGVGLTVIGIGLKSGLEFAGVNPLQAGNVVQLVLVLGLTVGWISTYIFRVSNKDMTYAQQLRDYENKVMEKRLETLTDAETAALLEQVEEEKRRLGKGEQG